MTRFDVTDPHWRAFVERQSEAGPFHHPDWAQLVADCYRFPAFAITVDDEDGTITAGLPLVQVRHALTRPKWVALPFTDHCPPLANSAADVTALVTALHRASGEAGVSRVHVRATIGAGAADTVHAFRHVLPLSPDADTVYAGFHSSQVKRSIRRAEREGVTIRAGNRAEDLLEVFYGLHLRTRHRQGVPIQPRRFFRLLWERAIEPGLGSVLIAEHAQRPLAAAVFLSWNGTVVYKFGASDQDAWPLRPNHLLFWHAIRTACERGDRWFDFGRTDSNHTSLREFKSHWGAREEPLVYQVLGNSSRAGGHSDEKAERALGVLIRRAPPWFCRATGEALYRYVA